MAKKKPVRARGNTGKDQKKREVSGTAPPEAEADRPFDFGGLPDRDLKKNLGGCG